MRHPSPATVWRLLAVLLAGVTVAGLLWGPRQPTVPFGVLSGLLLLPVTLVWVSSRIRLASTPPISLSLDTLWSVALVPLLGWPLTAALLLAAGGLRLGGQWASAQPPALPPWVEWVWTRLGESVDAPWRTRWRHPAPSLWIQPLATMWLSAVWAAAVWAAVGGLTRGSELAARGDFLTALPWWGVIPAVVVAWTVAETGTYAVLLAVLRPDARARLWARGTFRAMWAVGWLWAALIAPLTVWLVPRLGWGVTVPLALLMLQVQQVVAVETALAAQTAARHAAEADAQQDPLTGLPNRRAWDAYVAHLSAAGMPAVVAMADVDHFKQVNDTWGHEAGDAALQAVARRLRDACRTDRDAWPDLVARLGGEEFGLLLPRMPADIAPRRVEAIRQAVGASPILWHRQPIRLTCSVGAHWTPDPARVPDGLAAADRALYRAKAGGRNQTVWEPALSVVPSPEVMS